METAEFIADQVLDQLSNALHIELRPIAHISQGKIQIDDKLALIDSWIWIPSNLLISKRKLVKCVKARDECSQVIENELKPSNELSVRTPKHGSKSSSMESISEHSVELYEPESTQRRNDCLNHLKSLNELLSKHPRSESYQKHRKLDHTPNVRDQSRTVK